MSWPSKQWFYLLCGLVLVILLTVPILVFKKTVLIPPPSVVSFSRAKGPESAPILITEYSDFQCPSCQAVQATLNEILEKYPGKIRLVFRHFPLKSHRYSPLAHQAAECANEQGQFWPFHDHLYQNQLVWSSSLDPLQIFMGYAADLGLNKEQFMRCLQSSPAAERINADLASGKAVGVSSTPTFFVADKILVGYKQLLENVDSLIQEKLGVKRK